MPADTVTYVAKSYTPELVAARYVRPDRAPWGKGRWLVFECAALPEGHRLAHIASGATLREYITDGDEIPQAVKDAAKASGSTVRWS